MSLDGRVLSQAKSTLDEKRKRHEEALQSRFEQVYAVAPNVSKIDKALTVTMSDLIGAALSPGSLLAIEDIRQKNTDLQDKRRMEIIVAGFPGDYLDEEYMCPHCKDTGFQGTKICACLLALYKEIQRASLSSLLGLVDNNTFDNFDLSYYDAAPTERHEIPPRRSMEIIYETCVEYARKFGPGSMNLFFNGAPGLGKTFLSACIARVVAENGNSVVYETATSVFTKFEDAKFMRTEDINEARNEVRRLTQCDLLILDDLGTEMTTVFTVSALYELVNTRLLTNRKTIISSNLAIYELRRRYSEQIMSRLEGEYHVLTFRGDDIRKKKNAL